MNLAIALVTAVTAVLLFSPRVHGSPTWRATVTPLASIIGSGFLIIGPILIGRWGDLAPVAMLALCAFAFALGAAIRSNIVHVEAAQAAETLPRGAALLERASDWALGFAYVISVTYYLNLFGAFLVEEIGGVDETLPRIACTATLTFIGLFGFARGLAALEKLEVGAVGVKLAIIAGLLAGMALHAVNEARAGTLPSTPADPGSAWEQLAVLAGLIVTVQGFETSRYLGSQYDAATRVRTMRHAQLLSGGIYLVYTFLVGVAMPVDSVEGHGETAIIEMSRAVAPILPGLLVVAALASQFSAAVADTNGGGGLFEELSGGRLRAKWAFLLMAGAGVALTWAADVFQIIALASRAFAAYYALQCAVAARVAGRRRPLPALAFAVLALACLGAAVFGIPAE
ncbi:MAG: hypothetical protein CMN30_10610 [Sandaracinus sp.]|nr:hypothetical protein [Sandaracinus sp.]